MTITFTEQEYGKVNKTEWKPGPWNEEADKLVWKDPKTGLDCMIVRNHMLGFLCGYVGVPKQHQLHGVEYTKVQDYLWMGHGGLTYSAACKGDICHLADEGDHVWWFGFDCGHLSDHAPASPERVSGRYCTIDYVKDQVTSLAFKILHGEKSEDESESEW